MVQGVYVDELGLELMRRLSLHRLAGAAEVVDIRAGRHYSHQIDVDFRADHRSLDGLRVLPRILPLLNLPILHQHLRQVFGLSRLIGW